MPSTFEDYYDYDLKEWMIELNSIIMKGKTLSHDDCDRFWSVFKKAMKESYEQGFSNATNQDY